MGRFGYYTREGAVYRFLLQNYHGLMSYRTHHELFMRSRIQEGFTNYVPSEEEMLRACTVLYDLPQDWY